jgi:Na+/melibiose symporter-like transporter
MALPQFFNRSQHLIIKMPLKYTLTTKGTPMKKYTLLAALLLAPLASLHAEDKPYLSTISDLGISVCLVGFWLLMPAFLGDISDAYERATGQSCQGSLSALYGIAVKVGASSALLLTGYILVVCGFNAEMPLAEMAQPLLGMRALFAVVPALGLGISWWAMRQFRFAAELKA